MANTDSPDKILRGKEGRAYIQTHSKLNFFYKALTDVEDIIVDEIMSYFILLKSISQYTEDVDVKVAYNLEKQVQHGVVIELQSKKPLGDSLGGNKSELTYEDDQGKQRDFLQYAGAWGFNLIVRCRSSKRDSVAVLTDALDLGLRTTIHKKLAHRDILLPLTGLTMEGIVPKKLFGDVNLYETTLTFPGIIINWVFITEMSGEIITDFVIQPEVDKS